MMAEENSSDVVKVAVESYADSETGYTERRPRSREK